MGAAKVRHERVPYGSSHTREVEEADARMTDGVDRGGQGYKILMISPTSFFSDYGCSVRILEEARVLQRLGHEVTVCTYRNGQDVPGLTIRRTPGIPFREHYEVGSSPHKIGFDFLLFFTVLLTALRRRPDVIHAHMHEGALIGLVVGGLLHIPMVFDFQGSLTGEMMDHKFLRRDSLFYRPLCWLETAIDRLSPAIVTSSHNATRLLIEQFGCDPDRIEPVADCVDLQVFYPRRAEERAFLDHERARLGIPADRCVVVYLGLLADYQGTDALLHAAAQLLQKRADVHFLIMGFPSVEYYQGMARALGITDHVTFTGKIPYHQARDYLALGDVAVAPKLSATEGSGKILNYMALGLPTVAFDTPVSREYLEDQGFYAQPGDPASLADALHAALSRSDSRQRGTALRQMAVERYRWECAAQRILHAYNRVCQTQPVVL
jgi:glycosyltransferase involved in cell wall biosynthesis